MLIGTLILCAYFLVSEALVQHLALPIPSSVLGMLLLFFSLCAFPRLQAPLVQVSRFVAKNLALFFIPAGVGVMNYFGLIAEQGWRLILILWISTAITLIGTSWILDKLARKK
ncbi:hypothetical protein BDW_12810 [Bdellovibrio bacteriovorus W]|nr:hypothetical protein BDW_12810 [Bdellovibrio bacteriovorus W]